MRMNSTPQRSGSSVETSLWAIVNAIHEVTDSVDEALAVLGAMLVEGRISVLAPVPVRAARRPSGQKSSRS